MVLLKFFTNPQESMKHLRRIHRNIFRISGFQLIEAKCIQLFSSSLTRTSFVFLEISDYTTNRKKIERNPVLLLHMLQYHIEIALHRHEPSKKTKQFAV